MNNVNDLTKTSVIEKLTNSPQTQGEITLSAIKDTPTNNTEVSINTTNGLSGVAEEQPTSRPTININPRRKVHRVRSGEENVTDNVKVVDPNDYIEKPAPPKSETPRDRALNELEAAVMRKRKEFQDFIDAAYQEDKENRELVEAGIETVDGELQYMPTELQEDLTEEEKSYTTAAANNRNDDFEVHKKNNPLIDDLVDDDLEDYDFEPEEESDDFPEEETTINTSNISIKKEDIFEVEEDLDEEPQAAVEAPVEEEVTAPVEEEVKEEEPYEGGIFSKPISVTSSAFDNNRDTSSDEFEIDEEDLEGIVEPVDDVLSDEEVIKIAKESEARLKSEILKKIIQTGKSMNTENFVVSNKVINIKDALKSSTSNKVERTAVWPLTYAGRPYKASALKGPEIAMLADADNSDANGGVGLTIDQARIMFEHDANPYRPATIEAWAKTIPYSDVENIFAALYSASLKGANYIPMACPKNSCQYAYLSEDVSIEDMIKFNNDDAKKRFEEVKKMEITPQNTGSYESVVNVINDKFAVGLKIPSIFTVLYEYDSLNEDFAKKYEAMVSIIQYIDYIYYIDEENNQFQPIGWKTYHGDNGKSFKSKIATYSKILKEFDDTDFTVMIALINSMIDKVVESRGLTYEIPESKCPKCNSVIEARPINARGLLFMRQRLVGLATTPSER